MVFGPTADAFEGGLGGGWGRVGGGVGRGGRSDSGAFFTAPAPKIKVVKDVAFVILFG
jgi:hypothetical protein